MAADLTTKDSVRVAEMARNVMATEAPYAPATIERRVRTDLEVSLTKPCMHLLFLIISFVACNLFLGT